MKKINLLAIIAFTSAFFVSCKKEVAQSDSSAQIDSIVIEEKDSLTLAKEARQKEREALAKPYDDTEDAQAKINELLIKAKAEGKNIFVQAGGNWCIWCLRFNDYVSKNADLKKLIDENFIYYHLNYSKENKNEDVFAKYAPEGRKLGFPFFFIIDANDNVLNIISSEGLENKEDKSQYYDFEKTKNMFLDNVTK